MRLEKKMIICMSGLVLVVMFILQFIFFKNICKLVYENRKNNLNIYSKVLSLDQIVAENLYLKNKENINKHMLTIWPRLINLNSVKILDSSGEVYFYKNNKDLLKPNIDYEWGLRGMVKKKYKIHNSKNKYLQKFVSITYKNKLVGMVQVKGYHNKNKGLRNLFIEEIIIGIILIFSICVLLSIFLAKNIKAQIFGYEPLEIANIHIERQLIFDSLSDQVVTLDNYGKFTKTNEKAKINFNEKDKNVLRKLYDEVLLKEEKHIFNRRIVLSSGRVFINCIKITQGRDKFEILFIIKQEEGIKKIAQEITGVTQIINSMRANVHEFKNKIHVISGLLKLEEYEEVKKYVSNIRIKLDEENNEVQKIEDPVIKALLLTKISLAKEKQIFLNIKNNSNLMKQHNNINSDDLIVIIGNLIENAMESYGLNVTLKKEINIKLSEDENKIHIFVTDNGEKILNINRIFQMGYSSKGEKRGSGLALVKNLVSLYGGKINIMDEQTQKTFYIELTKEV